MKESHNNLNSIAPIPLLVGNKSATATYSAHLPNFPVSQVAIT